MKQLKVPKVSLPIAPPPAPRGPRYRYFLNPPSTVQLRLGDVASKIPEDFRASSFDQDRILEVPCQDILEGPVPKISLSSLAELAPECFSTPNVPDKRIPLPVTRLAMAYRMVVSSELIEEPEPEPSPVEPEVFSFAPPADAPPENAGNGFYAQPFPEAPQGTPAQGYAPTVETTGYFPPIEPPAPPQHSFAAPSPIEAPIPVAAEIPSTPFAPVPAPPPVAPPVYVPPAPAPIQALEPLPVPPINPKPAPPAPVKRAFSILPIFRRKEKEPEPEPEKPPVVEARPRVEIPKPRTMNPLVPRTALAAESVSAEAAPAFEQIKPVAPQVEAALEPPTLVAEEIQPPVISMPPAEPAQVAVLIETEHFPKPGTRPQAEISNQEGLQAIFLTEEFLAVERVIELCGGLPGIRSCVLSQSSTVLASHNVPDNIDLVSLSAHAEEMLRGMREASAKMGIGAVPAVTVHSDKGPITFFNQEDICLLVLHKDRGFVPGVREKLQRVVEELSRANLPLPVSPAKQALNA